MRRGVAVHAVLIAAFSWVSCLASELALSQQASTASAAASQSADAGLEDIVVTARRRDESLSKVPVAIVALTADSLTKEGVRSEADLQTAVPGLLLQQGGSNEQITYSIRGQTIDQYSASPPAVLTYVDEFQSEYPSSSSFFDLDNVQVLKGPQGTLFGRNTTGGAVLYTTVKPGDTFTGYVDARYGSFDERQFQFGVTLPLSPVASFRLAGNYSDGGGYVTNLGYYNGVGGVGGAFVPEHNTLGSNANKSVRATLLLRPVEWLRNTTMVQDSSDAGTSVPAFLYSFLPNSAAAPFVSGQVPPFSGLGAFLGWQRTTNNYTYTNSTWDHIDHDYSIVNTTDADIANDVLFKNIVGWNRYTRNIVFDFDGSPWHLLENPNTNPAQANTYHQFSEEPQLQGKAFGESLTYVVGAFYANDPNITDNTLTFYDVAPSRYHFLERDRSYAGFEQITYSVTNQLHLTEGFRYTKDDIDGHQLGGSLYAPGGPGFSPIWQQQQTVDFHKPSWTLGVDYQLTPDLLLYITQRGSWRSGEFNFAAPPITATAAGGGNVFLPETTKDVELGAKFNGVIEGLPVTAAADVYNQWVSNIQRGVFIIIGGVPSNLTVNVPNAQVTGIEGSFSIKPAPWIEVGAQSSYSDARFTNPNTVVLGNAFSFGPYGFSPKWSGATYVDLTRHLEGDSTIDLRGDAFAVSSFYFSNLADTFTPGTQIPGYALVNATLAWKNLLGTRLTASIYVKNMLDKRYYTGGLGTMHADGVNIVSPGVPRNFGGELRYSF